MSSETTCFVVQNGGPHFAENRLSSADGGIGFFAKWPFSRLFAHIFDHPSLRTFFSFVLFCLLARKSKRSTDAKRYETRAFGAVSGLSTNLFDPF